MKIFKKFLIIMLMTTAMHSYCNSDKLLFIDSFGFTAYHYNTLFTLLKAGGFYPVFKPLHHLDAYVIDQFETIIVALSPDLLSLYHETREATPSNPLALQGITLLETLKKQHNKVIVLLFPSVRTPEMHQLSVNLLKTLANNNVQLIESLDPLWTNFFAPPCQGLDYHTLLIAQRADTTLPQTDTEETHPVIPDSCIALHYSDTRNQYFIGKIRAMAFAEINEDCMHNPLDYSVRQKKLLQLQHFIQIIKAALHNTQTEAITIKDTLPYQLTAQYDHEKYKKDLLSKTNNTIAAYDSFNKKKIWLGWTELRTYRNQEMLAAKNILKSGINLLWIELRPEYYLSTNAVQAHNKEQFLQDLKKFTCALKEQSNILKIAAPALFIGTTITSNFYKLDLPTHQQAFDAYGTAYPQIPAPLERSFWTTEIIQPLEYMIDNWQALGSGLPLGGIFFDFEMYFNKISEYTNYMDFSNASWTLYCQHTNNQALKTLETINERVDYLIQNRKFNDYLTILQTEAYSLGKWIKKTLQQKAPHLMIGAYLPTAPHTWFYLGIFAGLGNKQEPVILATFNNEFYRHSTWLKEHQLYAYHVPVLLLSKLQKPADFKLIPQLSYNNNGVWFNRISHWEESRNKEDWPWAFGLEVTPLDTPTVTTLMSKAIQDSQDSLKIAKKE